MDLCWAEQLWTQSSLLEFYSGCKFIQIRSVPDSLQRYSLVTVVSVLLPNVGFVFVECWWCSVDVNFDWEWKQMWWLLGYDFAKNIKMYNWISAREEKVGKSCKGRESSGSHLLFLMFCYKKQHRNTNYPLKGILAYIYSYTHLSTAYTGTFVHICK